MTVYATYSYYAGTFLGTVIASADFPHLVLKASAVIDQLTFGRTAAIVTAATDTTTIELIKMATCAVAEEILSSETSGTNGRAIQSETVGRYSVTYTDLAKLTPAVKISKAASMYLASTGLMYPGFSSGEYSGAVDAD